MLAWNMTPEQQPLTGSVPAAKDDEHAACHSGSAVAAWLGRWSCCLKALPDSSPLGCCVCVQKPDIVQALASQACVTSE